MPSAGTRVEIDMLDGAFIRQTAARGVVAAMAMSGMRQVTTKLGLLDVTVFALTAGWLAYRPGVPLVHPLELATVTT